MGAPGNAGRWRDGEVRVRSGEVVCPLTFGLVYLGGIMAPKETSAQSF